MNIEIKTLGMLIDELCTVSQKCFRAQDIIMSSNDSQIVSTAAKDAQNLNKKRNELIRAIDRSVGDEEFSPSTKTY